MVSLSANPSFVVNLKLVGYLAAAADDAFLSYL
jgi:hypothetical protein